MAQETEQRVTVSATVRKKAPQLPAFVEIPSSAVAHWCLERTTTVLASFDGNRAVRRSLKPWDEERWFIDLPKRVLDSCGLEVGGVVEVDLVPVATELPVELADLLRGDSDAALRWERMTASRQRAIREHILSAAKPETRQRRAERALCGPGLTPGA